MFADKIVYYLAFRYSLNLEPNLSEIIAIKTAIVNSFEIVVCTDKKDIFPKAQIKFESKCMSCFPLAERNEKIYFEGISIHSPLNSPSDKAISI